MPSGLRESSADDSHAVELAQDDLLVLYTGGVDGPGRHVVERAVAGDSADDIAILTFRIADDDSNVRTWTFESSDAESARRARDEFVEIIRERGVCDDMLLYAARIVFGEMIGNVSRHAPRLA